MARDWKEVFSRWSKPLSDTEEAKASHAADMVRDAVKAHAPLAARRLDVYATGSVRNNTNVRAESDIDVAIVCHESIYYKLPDGTDAATFGITTPAAYSFAQFRNDLEAALRAKFGSAVKPTDKTFDVPEIPTAWRPTLRPSSSTGATAVRGAPTCNGLTRKA